VLLISNLSDHRKENKMYYQGYDTPELQEAISSIPKMPMFVREIHHTFGLKVYGVQTSYNNARRVNLCDPTTGWHVAEIYIRDTNKSDEDNENDEGNVEFCYHTDYYSKMRGRTNEDKHTLRSIKLSSLITNLKRCNAIPTVEKLNSDYHGLNQNVFSMSRTKAFKGTAPKEHLLDKGRHAEVFHSFLKVFFNEANADEMLKHDRNYLRETLDKFTSNEIAYKRAGQELLELFKDGFYAFGIDNETGDYMVGKYTTTDDLSSFVEGKNDGYSRMRINVLESKRVKSIRESYPELIPVLTMIKSSHESRYANDESFPNPDDWCFKRADRYDSDMGVANYYGSFSRRSMAWLVVPCSMF